MQSLTRLGFTRRANCRTSFFADGRRKYKPAKTDGNHTSLDRHTHARPPPKRCVCEQDNQKRSSNKKRMYDVFFWSTCVWRFQDTQQGHVGTWHTIRLHVKNTKHTMLCLSKTRSHGTSNYGPRLEGKDTTNCATYSRHNIPQLKREEEKNEKTTIRWNQYAPSCKCEDRRNCNMLEARIATAPDCPSLWDKKSCRPPATKRIPELSIAPVRMEPLVDFRINNEKHKPEKAKNYCPRIWRKKSNRKMWRLRWHATCQTTSRCA